MAVTAKQSALVLNAFAAYFENEMVTAQAVDWKQYDGEMNDRNRLEVIEQIDPNVVVTETDNGVADLSAGTQDLVFGSEIFKVNKSFGTSMGWGDFEAIQTVGDARESRALKSAARLLAQQIDGYILEVATLASNNWTGTVTANITDQNDAVSAYTRLKEEGVEDGDMRYIVNYTDRQLLGDQVINLTAPDKFATSTYKEGFDSMMNGIPTLFTQQLPTLTVGTRAASGAAQVDGAAENVNYVDVANQTSNNGWYMTQLLDVKNLTAGHTIVAGEVFTISGVNAYDNRKQAAVSPARAQQFKVVVGGTADGSGDVQIRIFPAIIVPVPGATTGNNAINTAHATVTAVPADSAPITFLGTASATLAPRLLIQKDAIVVNTQQLRLPVTGIGVRRRLENIPLSVRMWSNSTFGNGAFGVRFDLMLNANIRDPRRVCRFNGS
jgi:hypothetical protein